MQFKAWQGVKVTNEGSGYFGHAGLVVRTEQQGEKSIVSVELDSDNSVQPFAPSELEALG